MKHFSLVVLCIGLVFAANVSAAGQMEDLKNQCNAKKNPADGNIVPMLCIKDRVYKINYDQKSRRILLKANGVKIILQKIPQGYDPSLVGTDIFIGFLANELQVYGKNNIILYVSAVRTNGGGGGGQCGSGSEIYLNFLDIKEKSPKIKSKILIGSCAESIELADQDISSGMLGDIFLEKNNIFFRFLNYKNFEGSPTATVTPDFAKLLFKE